MFGVSPLSGKDYGLLKVRVKNLLIIKYVRNQMVISLIIDARKFSSYCNTIKLSENCLFIKTP